MSRAYRRYLCIVCGYIYDEAKGDPHGGLPPGTLYEDIPDDWECPECGVKKTEFVLLEESAPRAAVTESSHVVAPPVKNFEQIVIVGAGMAGWQVAKELRARDPHRAITLITQCGGDLYFKPQLSTAFARGAKADALVRSRGVAEAAKLNVTLLTRTRVLVIDTQRKRLITPCGGISYGRVVLALGARQRKVAIYGDAAEEVYRVNDLSSYRAFQNRVSAHESARVVLLGAGLIGCEFADDLAAAGHRVTLVDLAERPLSRLLPPELSMRLADTFTAKGIHLRLRSTIHAIWRDPDDALRVELDRGESIAADAVLSALGLDPEIRLARRSGLEVGVGIKVDEYLRTSCPDIYAVGDCTEHHGRVLPYVRPLREQAEVVAANLCGDSRRYRPVAGTIAVKTPSLPMAVYTPEVQDGEWVLTIAEGNSAALEYRAGGRLLGFALSGSLTRRAFEFEKRIGERIGDGVAECAVSERLRRKTITASVIP